MTNTKVRAAPLQASLVGRFFHTFVQKPAGRILEHQGVVEGIIEPGYYLVQYFEWMMGADSYQGVVHISEMLGDKWQLYASSEEARDWYAGYKSPRVDQL